MWTRLSQRSAWSGVSSSHTDAPSIAQKRAGAHASVPMVRTAVDASTSRARTASLRGVSANTLVWHCGARTRHAHASHRRRSAPLPDGRLPDQAGPFPQARGEQNPRGCCSSPAVTRASCRTRSCRRALARSSSAATRATSCRRSARSWRRVGDDRVRGGRARDPEHHRVRTSDCGAMKGIPTRTRRRRCRWSRHWLPRGAGALRRREPQEKSGGEARDPDARTFSRSSPT